MNFAAETSDWIEALEHTRVPCGPINAVGEVFAEPQAEGRNLVRTLDHASGVTIPTVANPMRFSYAEIRYDRPPPLLGQHTAEVLHQHLGLSAADIAASSEDAYIISRESGAFSARDGSLLGIEVP